MRKFNHGAKHNDHAQVRAESAEDSEAAIQAVLEHTQALMHQLGIAEPLRVAAALSDGEQLLAFRFSRDNHPPTLCLARSPKDSICRVRWLEISAGTVGAIAPCRAGVSRAGKRREGRRFSGPE